MASVVIAVDPGTVDTGICLGLDGRVLGTERLHVPKNWKSIDRIINMVQKVEEYVFNTCRWGEELLHEPVLAYELPGTFHGDDQQGRPIIALHQLIAVLEFWARAHEIRTFAYPVNDVKEGVAGYSTAPKKEVQFIMSNEYGLIDVRLSDHEWDAISVLTYHLRQAAIAERTLDQLPNI